VALLELHVWHVSTQQDSEWVTGQATDTVAACPRSKVSGLHTMIMYKHALVGKGAAAELQASFAFLASDDVLKLLFTMAMHFWESHVTQSPYNDASSLSDELLQRWQATGGALYDAGCRAPCANAACARDWVHPDAKYKRYASSD
jgi:Ni,Fe-hydrogenase I small subunit